jgi:hypothetical protein
VEETAAAAGVQECCNRATIPHAKALLSVVAAGGDVVVCDGLVLEDLFAGFKAILACCSIP